MGKTRRGFALVELLAAMAVLSVVAAIAVQAMVEQQAWRRRADARELALLEAEATLERLAALPWEQLTPARLAEARLSDDAQSRLAGARLSATVDEQRGPPDAKRLGVEISWPATSAATIGPVRLVTWVCRHDR